MLFLWSCARVAPLDTGVTDAHVVLNELVARNDSTWQDEKGAFPDWLELYNAGTVPVALERLELRDESGASWTGGQGYLAAGERLLLAADDRDGPGSVPFKLSSEGETVRLYVGGERVDAAQIPALDADVAYARCPDGGAWAPTIFASPGRENPTDPGESLDPSDLIFTDRVLQLHLSVEEHALARLEEGGMPEVPASLEVLGLRFEQVGLRLKGTSSYRDLSGKAAFKVDLNELVPGQRLRGLKGLTLNNANQDATWTHEYLTYHLFRAAGLPAPRVAFAEVFLNEELFGLYVLVEDYDDLFLARWFEQVEQARLWEGELDDFEPGHVPAYEYEEGPLPEDQGVLEALSEQLALPAELDISIEALEELVDLDAYLAFNALEALTLHLDGYQHLHNFYLVHHGGRFTWLPAGADHTWYALSYGPYDGEGAQLRYCLANTSCAARYEAALRDAVDLAEGEALQDRFDELTAWLDPYIQRDPRREHDDELVALRREETRRLLGEWPALMLEEVDARPTGAAP